MKIFEAIKNLTSEQLEKFLDQVFLTGFNSGYQSLVDPEIHDGNPFDEKWLNKSADKHSALVEDKEGKSMFIEPLVKVAINIAEFDTNKIPNDMDWVPKIVLPEGLDIELKKEVEEENKEPPGKFEPIFVEKFEQASNWDGAPSRLSMQEIDLDELGRYITKANVAGRLNYPHENAEDILDKLNLKVDGTLSNAAEVMFGKEPKLEMQMAIFATSEKLTFNDLSRVSGRIIDLVDMAEKYIRNAMRYRVIIDGTQLARKEVPEIPHVAIREALLNSYCHRNYNIPQNNEVAIFSDRIEIYNPGTFPEGLTPDDFIQGRGRSIHRNPLLAQIMCLSKDIESFGTGLKRISDECDSAGIKYKFLSDNYGFTVVFYRPPLRASDDVSENGSKKSIESGFDSIPDIPDDFSLNISGNVPVSISNIPINNSVNISVNEGAALVLSLMKENKAITYDLLSEKTGFSRKILQRNVQFLKDAGLVRRIGSNKTGHWEVLDDTP